MAHARWPGVRKLFDAARNKFKKLWGAADIGETQPRPQPTVTVNDQIEPITADMVRDAAKSFAPSTSSTYDGLHPRHLSLISDKSLKTVASFLNLVEDIGEWPEGIAAVVAVLIPKPKGGVRPIGMFAGLYRVWARTRRAEAAKWERQHDHPAFAAKEGNGALDTV